MPGDGTVSSRLDPLQEAVLRVFFAQTTMFRLTGGAALGGFYLRHRATEDLDLFAAPPSTLAEGDRALRLTVSTLGAAVEVKQDAPDFRRYLVSLDGARTVVDLVIDRVPRIDADVVIGTVHLESEREIAANKVCTLLSRMEPRDLFDLRVLLQRGHRLEDVVAAARIKDGGADPATLAWVLSTWRLPAHAAVPPETTTGELEEFRRELVEALTRLTLPDSASR
jgi:predicted nucleotidyltransferase component of viral defense system